MADGGSGEGDGRAARGDAGATGGGQRPHGGAVGHGWRIGHSIDSGLNVFVALELVATKKC